jgi:arylsulfatase A-like enzyme
MSKPVRNILFIMADQLRWDYLSCYGHPTLRTPNIDALARRGVIFDRAYVQSPICGPSRMSFYTGRYPHSHGSTWNGVPLKLGERTLGDHLRELGQRVALVGKTHMKADLEGMMRMGVDPASQIGVLAAECGFEPYERFDGLHPRGPYDPNPRYNDYLREQGYDGDNPWDDVANAAEDEQGRVLSGWFMKHADRPARVREEDSETAWTTRRAMSFIDEAGASPWCLHLSYIKPHWPYIAPAPYHALYGPQDVMPAVRSEAERADAHPIHAAFMKERVARAFSDEKVRTHVIPAYMGLIAQIDDWIGRLMQFLEARGLLEETMIVFTADHGDYLGDHWLGEKELFHEPSVRIPLIVVDPRKRADATRGGRCSALVEAVDLVPTFIEAAGGAVPTHIVEGRSLLPWLEAGSVQPWREAVFSEYDYSRRIARVENAVPTRDATLFMVFDGRWKLIHAPGFRPMLFDLQADPQELRDLGADPSQADICRRLERRLLDWALRPAQRTTISDAAIEATYGKEPAAGILIGYWDESERG